MKTSSRKTSKPRHIIRPGCGSGVLGRWVRVSLGRRWLIRRRRRCTGASDKRRLVNTRRVVKGEVQ
jgi:hypothetical protein